MVRKNGPTHSLVLQTRAIEKAAIENPAAITPQFVAQLPSVPLSCQRFDGVLEYANVVRRRVRRILENLPDQFRSGKAIAIGVQFLQSRKEQPHRLGSLIGALLQLQ